MSILYEEKKPLQDHCGIVASFSPMNVPFFEKGLAGLSVLQTRGYDGAGFCALDTSGHISQYKGQGMVREVFSPKVVENFKLFQARSWVFQVRYGTSGAFVSDNVQPIISSHEEFGETFVVVHNGQFSRSGNATEAKQSDTLLFTKRLSKQSGRTWEDRIVPLIGQMRGAWSLVISTKDALYVARDPWGFRPFVYGHIWDASINQYIWVAASETSALEAMGVTDYFELLPGTVGKISQKGLEVLARHQNRERALCIFENIYLHHGAGRAHLPRTNQRAIKKSPTVDDVRRRCGKILAREAPVDRRIVDMVIGVPGTGIEGGMVYARALDIPYFQAITDRAGTLTEQRTFMTADIESIYQKVLHHFHFDSQALFGRRVVLVDDSIVRGNITKGLVYLLTHHYGVRSVHIRVLSPQIDKACHLGVNTRTINELVSSRFGNDVEKIRKYLKADSLAYITAHGLKEALTGDPKAKGFCMGCMVGHRPPVDVFGNRNYHHSPKEKKGQKVLIPPFPHIQRHFAYKKIGIFSYKETGI